MAKKTKLVRVDEGSGRTVVERLPARLVRLARPKLRRAGLLDGLGHVAAGVAGGAAGGTATAVLMRVGASPRASGFGVMLAGGAAAVLTSGKTRTFSAAAAGMGLAPILASVLSQVGGVPQRPASAQ